jgi:hypothetical protein
MGITVLLSTERCEVLEETGEPANHLHGFLPCAEDPEYVLVKYITFVTGGSPARLGRSESSS